MKGMMKKWLGAGAVALALSCASVQGAGFAIIEQSTPGLGRGLAGMAADVKEAGAIYFNPAVGAFHEKDTLALGTSFLHVNAHLDIANNSELQGNNGGEGGGWERIPHLYWVHPFGDGLSLGIGVSGTSGTSTAWDRHWVGRETAILTSLAVMNFSPSLSYKINDEWSVGAGINIEQARVTMTMGLPKVAYVHPLVGPLGFTSSRSQLKLKGDSIQVGFTAGVLYQPTKATRIGLGYRSPMTHELDLDADMRFASEHDRQIASMLTGGKTGGKAHLKGDADCDLKLPRTVELGIQHDVNERWTVNGTVAWSQNSCMDKLKVEFDKNDPIVALSGTSKSIAMKWRDNWRFALGADYRYNEKWTFRFGTVYDQTPIKSANYRYATLPDVNRVWLTCGFSYAINETCTLDFGYVHIFFLDGDMVNDVEGKKLRINIDSKTSGCDIISTGLTFRF